jgi:hypothetical protein
VADITAAPHRVTFACPRCRQEVTVNIGMWPVLTQRVQYEVHLTLDVQVSGTTHKCREQKDLTPDQEAILNR